MPSNKRTNLDKQRTTNTDGGILKLAIDNMISFVAILELDGTLIIANNPALHQAELKISEVVGKKFWDCYWWNYNKSIQKNIKQDIARASKGELVHHTTLAQIANQNTLPIDFMLKKVHDNGSDYLIASGADISKRRIAEEGLVKSERHFRSLIEKSYEAITLCDDSWNYTYASPAIEPILGYSPKEFTKLNGTQLIHPDDLPNVLKKFEDFSAPGSVETTTCRFKHKNGEWRWIEGTAKNLLTDPAVRAIVSNFRDITEQVKSKQALSDKQAQLQLIIDSVPAFISYVDTNKRYLFANKTYLTWFNLKKENLHNKTVKQVIGQKAWAKAKIGIERALNGEVVSYENKLTKNNKTIFLSVQYIPHLDDKGAAKGFIVVGHDITAIKEALQVAQHNEQQLKFMSESIPQKIFTCFADGTSDYYNSQWTHYTGKSHEEIDKDGWQSLIHPSDLKENTKQWNHSIKTGEPFEYEHRLKRYDGMYRWHISRAHAMRDTHGKIIKWLGSNTDIHDIRTALEREHKLEEKAAHLSEQRKQLIELNQAKDEFISLASHQLRTPATSVKQFLGMLLEGYAGNLSKSQTSMAESAYSSNERQIAVINDLLKVARLDAGHLKIKKSNQNMYDLAYHAVQEQKRGIESKNQSIKLSCDNNKITANVDREKIIMVLDNLIDNASKYSKEDTAINITVSETSSTAIVIIEDSGVGIAKKDIPLLFKKFSRVDNPFSIEAGGTGLGLYWVKKVIDMHNGNVSVSSSKGRGSEFKIELPKQ